MTYLIAQILFSLLSALLLGFILGWLFARSGRRVAQAMTVPASYNPVPIPKPIPAATPAAPQQAVQQTATAKVQAVNQAYTRSAPPPPPPPPVTPTQFTQAPPPPPPPVRGSSLDEIDSGVNLSGKGYEIETLEGVGPKTATALREIGIATISDFLRQAHTPEQREYIASQIAVRPKMVHSWASMSDLLRIHGIDHQSAELMHKSGIHSVADLAKKNVSTFVSEMEHTNTAGKRSIAPQVPTSNQMSLWIAEASTMKPAIKL